MNADAQEFDTEVLDTLKEAIGDSLTKIINLYLTDTPNTLQQMQQALNQDDYETVGRLAHSLKSSSANLGALQVSNLAINLEQAINNSETDKSKLESAIVAIKTAFDQVSHKFGSYLQK